MALHVTTALLAVTVLFLGRLHCDASEDLIAEESNVIQSKTFVVLENASQQGSQNRTKYSSRIASNVVPSTELPYGLKLTRKKLPADAQESASHLVNRVSERVLTTERVLDFRIQDKEDEYADYHNNEVKPPEKKDMHPEAAGSGKQKKETLKKEEDEEEKTLAQQVADGKYGLIQDEIFSNGSKRPGILSYLSNPEVPRDTKSNLGGLEKEEIWLAEDHLLVLRGGRYPEKNETQSDEKWPPIDDYEAPPRQVKLPDNPKIPPPFPVQLTENGPVEFIKGENGTGGPPPLPPGGFPPFPFPPPNGSLPFPPFPFPPDELPNGTFPFPPGQLPPFLANLPPGAAFLPPPGNFTDFDEDDPSIYYPPRYDFYYPQDNTTAVPPGPLVPGIILPPPPDFFAPLQNDTDDSLRGVNDEENSLHSTRPPYVGPVYLPVPKPSPPKSRGPSKRPPLRTHTTVPPFHDISNQITDSSPPPELYYTRPKGTVTYVYPENSPRTTARPSDKGHKFRVPTDQRVKFASPIHVPSTGKDVAYHPLPTTSPKPNHITIPTNKPLSQEIYIVSTEETEPDEKNIIKEIYKEVKTKDPLDNLRPEVHPLRSLIKPNVTVSYVGKYGHLPASTPFPYPKRQQDVVKPYRGGGHYITKAPPSNIDIKENVIPSRSPPADISIVTVTPVPIVKKVRIRPVVSEKPPVDTTPTTPSKATYYFYEEKTTENPKTKDTQLSLAEMRDENKGGRLYHSTLTTARTPVRQFLEETFHASNVLQNKPQITPVTGTRGHGVVDDPKMKHLYPTAGRPSSVVKYHYITNDQPVVISNPNIKLLEIETPGSSGHVTTAMPFSVQQMTTYRPAEKPQHQTVSHPITTPKPFIYRNTDGPFIPSNYYATARPDDIHFTPPDHTMIDDITKNYFTIFGQKINSGSTTPIAPVTTTESISSVPKPKPSGLSYISDSELLIKQVHSAPPQTPKPVLSSTERPQYIQIVTPTPRPQSNFEQYLKELTGQDQKDFIITGVGKTKKGKANIPFQLGQLQPPRSVYINHLPPTGLSQYLEEVRTPSPPKLVPNYDRPPQYSYEGYAGRPKLPYRPNFTTLRPVMNVDIQPQYIQHISSTYRPFEMQPHAVLQSQIRNHNLGQYLQEITGFTSPTTINPVKIKGPISNLQYFPTTHSPLHNVKPIGFSQNQYSEPQVKPPISLEGDILVNYKPPRPEINPEAEIIDVHNPPPPFQEASNFRVVEAPDLSGKQNRLHYRRPYPQPPATARKPKPLQLESPKEFFENLPNSGYFAQPHQSSGNSFVSYNLPGNAGHFYFLTPQIADRNDEVGDEHFNRRRSEEYSNVKREEETGATRQNTPGAAPADTEQGSSYTNPDYLRRRRKKP